MGAFTLPDRFNPNRVFLLNKSELEKRFDPFYYVPEIVELEKKVLKKNPKKLRDYVLRISSGATPKTTESEKYYTDKENGFPFLRVQNLSPTGVLEFEDCKYINKETHSGLLKRSQVFEGDLLVKITGVGRMAVSSVVPEGFEGNINQHICVIRTGSKELSETIAAYLNSDIGERLASRRSTGGTRPALDYPALLSIPIIEDNRILQIIRQVVEQKQKSESEAERLLESIDSFLLNSLGIASPIQDININNRIFNYSLNNLSGRRFDPFYYSAYFFNLTNSIRQGNFKTHKISAVCHNIDTGRTPAKSQYLEDYELNALPIIKAGSYSNDFVDINKCGLVKSDFNGNLAFQNDIFILGAAHQAEFVGKKVFYLPFELKEKTFFVGELVRITVDSSKCDSAYLFNLLKTELYAALLNREKRGQTSHLYPQDVKQIYIPLPPLEVQKTIAQHITEIRLKAQLLKEGIRDEMVKASKEIEKIVLST